MKKKILWVLLPLVILCVVIYKLVSSKVIKQTNDIGEVSFGLDELTKTFYSVKNNLTDSFVSLLNGLDFQKKETESLKVRVSSIEENGVTGGGGTVDLSAIEQRLNALEYVPFAINSFTNSVNYAEKGATVTQVDFLFSFNKPPTSASINNGIGAVTGSSKSATVNITQDTTFVLTASDGQTTKTSSTNIKFLSKVYWGTSPQPTLNNEGILALLNSRLASNRVNDITIDGNGEYIYYVSPVDLGAITFTIGGLVSANFTRTEIAHINAQGYQSQYYIYRTNSVQFGSGINIKTS